MTVDDREAELACTFLPGECGRSWLAVLLSACLVEGITPEAGLDLDNAGGRWARARAWAELAEAGRYSSAEIARVWGAEPSAVCRWIRAHKARAAKPVDAGLRSAG